MKRIAPILVLSLLLAACGSDAATTTSTTVPAPAAEAAFPVTIEADNGRVTIEERPDAIVSMSPTATEMLFAIDAGPQVVAVDDQSDYPDEAPMTDLSGFTPNLEAILSYEPDLVVLSFDPADSPVVEGLSTAGVPTLLLEAATELDEVYDQIEVLGDATGNRSAADEVNRELQAEIAAIVAETADLAEGVTYYHELDPSFFTVTSDTFVGQIYGLLGMVNIADGAGENGVAYPQLSAEYIVAQDPDMIFLADAGFGESADTLAQRPGWEGMTALENGAVVELDADVASRWGPRIVEFLRTVADAVSEHSRAG